MLANYRRSPDCEMIRISADGTHYFKEVKMINNEEELHFCTKDNFYCSEGSGYFDIWTKENFLESSPIFLFKCSYCPFCGHKASKK